ncbi:hypothetical protein CDEST_06564 [Colletotrichum destructivum]|uniref:Uncharacterized protein n=1 Tax=Colletotrichum destructivum TaxID=34406 RepID=A0AAX4IDS8_9PEZI|nr:hypothetical protein CDEST_06564 [Colletotrichum destructivum]
MTKYRGAMDGRFRLQKRYAMTRCTHLEPPREGPPTGGDLTSQCRKSARRVKKHVFCILSADEISGIRSKGVGGGEGLNVEDVLAGRVRHCLTCECGHMWLVQSTVELPLPGGRHQNAIRGQGFAERKVPLRRRNCPMIIVAYRT